MSKTNRMLLDQMQAVEDTRQALSALVAGLVADGFSDEQARDIIVGMWRHAGKPKDGE